MTTFFRQTVLLAILGGSLVACKTEIDPALRPFIGLKKDQSRFLAMNVDQQIDTYLQVAALSLKPPDYSPSALIALSGGDIGQKLTGRIIHENDVGRLANLVRLAGDYCYLNKNCRGQQFLESAVHSAVGHIPNAPGNPYVGQSVQWVSKGVAGQIEAPK